MHKILKALGHIVTWFICAITIDKIDVSESFFLNYFVISPIIHVILWLLSYSTCNKIIYQKLNINIPEVGSIGYTIAYIMYALILFAILIALKRFEIIPFANDFDIKLIDSITQYFNNLIINYTNNIIEVLQASN